MARMVVGKDVGSYVYSATNKTITFSDLSNLRLEDIFIIINPRTGETIFELGNILKGGTFSSDVLTMTYVPVTAGIDGEDLQIFLEQGSPEIDFDIKAQNTLVKNPTWSKYTAIEELIDEVNVAVGTYRKSFEMETYRNASIHLKGTGGVTFSIWATNDSSATELSDDGWVDVSQSILGVSNLIDDEGIYFVDTSQMPLKFMIKYTTTDTSNAIDALIRGY